MSIFLAFIRFFVVITTVVSFFISFFLTFIILTALNEGMANELKYDKYCLTVLCFIVGCIVWSMINKKIKKLQQV